MIDHPLTIEARELLAMQSEMDADLALLKLFERIQPPREEFNAACVRVCKRADRISKFKTAFQALCN